MICIKQNIYTKKHDGSKKLSHHVPTFSQYMLVYSLLFLTCSKDFPPSHVGPPFRDLAPAPGGAGEFRASRALRSGAGGPVGWTRARGPGPLPDAPCKDYVPTWWLIPLSKWVLTPVIDVD